MSNNKDTAPREQLKRFADGLKGSTLQNRLYREINMTRVDDFIHKDPLDSRDAKLLPSSSPSSASKIPGLYKYDLNEMNDRSKELPLANLPVEFDNVLGPKSRFGDGDGSFWDRWVNRNGQYLESRSKGVDSEGFPLIQSGQMHGFKTFYSDKSMKRLNISSYEDRKKDRILSSQNNHDDDDDFIKPEIGPDIDSKHDSTSEFTRAELHSPSDNVLPYLDAADEDAYFGSSAKSSFFEFYREILAKVQQVNFKVGIDDDDNDDNNNDANNNDNENDDNEKEASLSAEDIGDAVDEFDLLWDSHLNPTSSQSVYCRPNSPRSNFIIGCVQKGLIARPSLILRNKVTPALNLDSQLMGDEYAIEFSAAIEKLPYFVDLNIANNKLTDFGLVAIAKSLSKCTSLKCLNISRNKGTMKFTESMVEYMTSGNCRLETFVAQESNVDSFQLSEYIKAISGHVKSLTYLDLSHNAIGSKKMSNLNTNSHKDVSNLLEDPKCGLRTLHIGWNEVSSDYASRFCTSLRFNRSLTELDLSSNKLGTAGGIDLGDTLHDNKTLKILNIANNGITARACSVLMTGIVSVPSLRTVNLSNNPIGEGGLRSYLMMETVLGHNNLDLNIDRCSLLQRDRNITCKHSDKVYSPYVKRELCSNCSLYARHEFCWFDWKVSSGAFTFDMTDPYDRSVCVDLLRLAAETESIKMHYFRYSDGSSASQDMDLCVQSSESSSTVDIGKPEAASIKVLAKLADDLETTKQLFKECSSKSIKEGSIDKEELSSLMRNIGVLDVINVTERVIAIYDVDKSGFVELEEFVDFLFNCKIVYNKNENFLKTSKYMSLEESPSVPYIPSRVGTVQCHFQNLGSFSESTKNLSSDFIRKISSLSAQTIDPMRLYDIILESTRLGLAEAVLLLEILTKELGDSLIALQKILPHMSSPVDSRTLTLRVISDNTKRRFKLKSAFGYLYRPIIGLPNGFYSLELGSDNDRSCLLRLRALSNADARIRVNADMGDISADGSWFGFRNSTLNGIKILIDNDWFNDIPRRGKLEFDFVKVVGPEEHRVPLSDDRFMQILKGMSICTGDTEMTFREQIEILNKNIEGESNHIFDSTFASEISNHLRELYCESGRREPHQVIVSVSDLENMKLHEDEQIGSEIERLNSFGSHLESLRSRAVRSFSTQDENGDGTITYRELGKTMKHFFGKKPSRKELLYFFEAFDNDGDGCIDFDEFFTMLAGRITPEMYCVCYLEVIEETLGARYITCVQLAVLVANFPGGDVEISKYGNYRVEIIIRLFSCIVDAHNFDYVTKFLTSAEMSKVLFRLGWLATFHPMKPYGHKVLDLSRREELQVYKLLMLLAMIESHELSDQEYKTSYDESSSSSVKEAYKWTKEENLPSVIIVSFMYNDITSSDVSHPHIAVRTALEKYVYTPAKLPDCEKDMAAVHSITSTADEHHIYLV